MIFVKLFTNKEYLKKKGFYGSKFKRHPFVIYSDFEILLKRSMTVKTNQKHLIL